MPRPFKRVRRKLSAAYLNRVRKRTNLKEITAEIRNLRKHIDEYKIIMDVHQQKVDEARETLGKDWVPLGEITTQAQKEQYLAAGERSIQSCELIVRENRDKLRNLLLARNSLLQQRKKAKRTPRKPAGKK